MVFGAGAYIMKSHRLLIGPFCLKVVNEENDLSHDRKNDNFLPFYGKFCIYLACNGYSRAKSAVKWRKVAIYLYFHYGHEMHYLSIIQFYGKKVV